MAIKGKKKSQSRGSQARRRPAAAPRAGYMSSRRTPWHQTPGGRVSIAVGLAVLFGLVVTVVAVVRGRGAETAEQRDALVAYTEQVGGVAARLQEPVGEMLAAPVDGASFTAENAVAAKGWAEDLQAVTTDVAGLFPPPSVAPVNQLLLQVVSLYGAAADTYALVDDAEGKLRDRLLARASAQRDQAQALFLSAVSVLDVQRSELDMGPAALDPPGLGSPTPPTDEGVTGEATAEPEPAEGGGGGKKESGDKDRRNGKKKRG